MSEKEVEATEEEVINEVETVEDEIEEVETTDEVEDDTETKSTDDTEEEHEEEESSGVVVTIGDSEEDAEEAKEAPEWVKDLRKSNKELKRQNKELQRQVPKTPESNIVVGNKPTMEDDGIDYDADKFAEAYEAWQGRKQKHDEQQSQIKNQQKERDKAWQGTLEAYSVGKNALDVKDYDDAEEVVLDSLSETQQGVILHGATDPALVVYALGKNSAKVRELSAIKDNVKFAFAIARLEATLKVTKRKPSTSPEKKMSGHSSVPASSDATLDKLRKEAEKTGDYSKVSKFKRERRNK